MLLGKKKKAKPSFLYNCHNIFLEKKNVFFFLKSLKNWGTGKKTECSIKKLKKIIFFNILEQVKDETGTISTSAHRISIWGKPQ